MAQRKTFLDIISLLILFFGIQACISNELITSTEKPAAPVKPQPDPIVNVPVTGKSESGYDHEPVINEIQFPKTVQANTENSIGAVIFSDNEGDIYAAQFTCLECGCMDFEYFAFDPTSSLRSGDAFSGTFQFQQTCLYCKENQTYDVAMQVQLFDREGNASAPANYSFTCIE